MFLHHLQVIYPYLSHFTDQIYNNFILSRMPFSGFFHCILLFHIKMLVQSPSSATHTFKKQGNRKSWRWCFLNVFYISQCVYFKTYWISNPYYYKRMINICNLVAQENYEFQIFLLHFTVTYCSLFTDVTLYSHMCHVRILLHVCFCDDIMCLDLTCTMWKYFLWPVCCFRKYIYAFNPILSHI